MSDDKEYRIVTLADITEKIPPERYEAFLVDFRNWLLNREKAIEAMEQLAQTPLECVAMLWINDGKNDLAFQLEKAKP